MERGRKERRKEGVKPCYLGRIEYELFCDPSFIKKGSCKLNRGKNNAGLAHGISHRLGYTITTITGAAEIARLLRRGA